jgi:hypothetical protein
MADILLAIGYAGTALIIAGIAGVGRKYRHALLFSAGGEACYILREWLDPAPTDWALLTLVSILLFVALDGWRRWQRAPEPVNVRVAHCEPRRASAAGKARVGLTFNNALRFWVDAERAAKLSDDLRTSARRALFR